MAGIQPKKSTGGVGIAGHVGLQRQLAERSLQAKMTGGIYFAYL